MIRQIDTDTELYGLLGRIDDCIEKQKILALAYCYGTKYDFCRFYKADNYVLCALNNSYILCGSGDIEELARFFSFSGYSEVFCSYKMGETLSNLLNCQNKKVNLMRFAGSGVACGDMEHNVPLEEFFKILKTGFEIEFEPWYLDISHRIRHGVSQVRRLGNSVLVIQHDLNGSALLSQIATSPESRGKGSASRLILAVCAELLPSKAYLICEDHLTTFYNRIGFEVVQYKAVLLSDSKNNSQS